VNDTLPTSLTQFGDELERAIMRELSSPEPAPPPRRPPRRRRMLVGAATGCAVAGAAAVAVVAAGGGSSNSAWAAQVLRSAEIALPKPAPNTIVHVSVTQTMTPMARRNVANAAAVVHAEGWFQQGAPWRWVARETVPGHPTVWETETHIYDPAVKRAYTLPPLPSGHLRYTLSNAANDGSFALRIETSRGSFDQSVTAAEAHALRTGADHVTWSQDWNGHRATLAPMVAPSDRSMKKMQARQPNDTSLSFPAQLHRLLQSGHAQVAARVTVDGRPAIKIELPGADHKPWMTYYVDPTTYRPIEFDTYGFGSTKDVTRLVFHAYQQLPIKGNARLLRLHTAAGTLTDRNATGYFRHSPATLFW